MTSGPGRSPIPVPPVSCAWCKALIDTQFCTYGFRSKTRKRALAGDPCFCSAKCAAKHNSWRYNRKLYYS